MEGNTTEDDAQHYTKENRGQVGYFQFLHRVAQCIGGNLNTFLCSYYFNGITQLQENISVWYHLNACPGQSR